MKTKLTEKERIIYLKGFDEGYDVGYERACRKILEDDVRQRGNSFEVRKIDEFICSLLKDLKERQANESKL